MSQLRTLVTVNLAAFLLMVGVGMIVAVLPARVLALSGSLAQVSYIASAFAISYLLVQVPLGRLADRIGFKPFLILGYGLCALAGLLYVQAGAANGIFLGRFVQGIGEAPIWALGPALLALAYPAARGRVIGAYNAAIHLGLMAGPLLGVWLFPSGGGAGAFWIFVALCLAAAVVTLLVLPRHRRQHLDQSVSITDVVMLMRRRGPAVTLLGILLYGAGYGSVVSVLPAYLATAKGFDHAAVSLFFTLFYLAIGVAQLVVGPLSDRYGHARFMIGGMAAAALGLGAMPGVTAPLIYLPIGVASLGLGVFCVASLADLSGRVPAAMKGTLAGSYYLAWGLGCFLGPLVIGALGTVASASAGYYLLAGLMALQSAALCLVARAR